MKLLIGGKEVDTSTLNFIDEGGEGEILELPPDSVLKVYLEPSEQRSRKVLALCDKTAAMAEQGVDLTGLILPEEPAVSGDSLLAEGFSMPYVKSGESLQRYFFSPPDNSFLEVRGRVITDAEAVQLCIDLFWLLFRIHRLRLTLGDVNPRNFLLDEQLAPYLIDLDSASFDGYETAMNSPLYVDPQALSQGFGLSGAPHYTPESDIYSCTCICFELFVGYHPFFLLMDPPRSTVENAAAGNTLLKAYVSGRLDGYNSNNRPLFEHIKRRMLALANDHGDLGRALHDQFEGVFANLTRSNPVEALVPRSVLTGVDEMIELWKRQNAHLLAPSTARAASTRRPRPRTLPGVRPFKLSGKSARERDPESLFGFMARYGFELDRMVSP